MEFGQVCLALVLFVPIAGSVRIGNYGTGTISKDARNWCNSSKDCGLVRDSGCADDTAGRRYGSALFFT